MIAPADPTAGEAASDVAARFVSHGIPAINPETGLSTDYLNHFSEAMMILDMAKACPDVLHDFLSWQPRSYREHFAASGFTERDRVIAAYESADAQLRQSLDTLAHIMNTMLLATREAIGAKVTPAMAQTLCDNTVASLKHLIMRAAAMINGSAPPLHNARPPAQTAIDALFAK